MRILMLSDVCAPRVNGVATSIRTFRKSLADLGHDSLLVAPEYPLPTSPDAAIVRVPSRPVPGDAEDRLMKWRDVLALVPQLARMDFDLVHVHTPFVAHYAGVRIARRLGLPLVETYHTFFEEYAPLYFPWLPARLGRWVARKLTVSQCRQVDALVVPSPQMLDRLAEYGIAVRAEVLPTGLEPEEFRGGDGARFRREHGIPPERPVLVFISRVAHEKNIDFLLRMLVRLRADVPDVLLVIAGEGPAVPHVRQLAQQLGLDGHVLFTGYLDRSGALLDCYRAGDAFVFASRTETQGLVLLEALALGVPVVSTAVMGTADVLRDARGAMIAPDEEAGFATAVARVLGDPDLRRRLALAGPSDAARWSARALAERLAALYADVARSHRPAPEPVSRPDVGAVPE
jgi:glycosyltransferase involved in cell wall biosynthesis